MPIETLAPPFGEIIPIVAIVFGIGVAFWAIYWDYRGKQLKYRERELMIERGMTPPEIDPVKKPLTAETCLRRGLILLFLGMGFGAVTVISHYSGGSASFGALFATAACIVGFLGIGFLVYWAVARKGASR
jgi:hypothetical protein